jgi:hypothetical protein
VCVPSAGAAAALKGSGAAWVRGQTKRARNAASGGLHERRPEAEVRSMLFSLFSRQPFWSLAKLIEETDQPQARRAPPHCA